MADSEDTMISKLMFYQRMGLFETYLIFYSYSIDSKRVEKLAEFCRKNMYGR